MFEHASQEHKRICRRQPCKKVVLYTVVQHRDPDPDLEVNSTRQPRQALLISWRRSIRQRAHHVCRKFKLTKGGKLLTPLSSATGHPPGRQDLQVPALNLCAVPQVPGLPRNEVTG